MKRKPNPTVAGDDGPIAPRNGSAHSHTARNTDAKSKPSWLRTAVAAAVLLAVTATAAVDPDVLPTQAEA